MPNAIPADKMMIQTLQIFKRRKKEDKRKSSQEISINWVKFTFFKNKSNKNEICTKTLQINLKVFRLEYQSEFFYLPIIYLHNSSSISAFFGVFLLVGLLQSVKRSLISDLRDFLHRSNQTEPLNDLKTLEYH